MLSHLPEQLASVSGPFAAGCYNGPGYPTHGYGVQPYPVWGYNPGFMPPNASGPLWSGFGGMGLSSGRAQQQQNFNVGAGVAAAAATATAASAPAAAATSQGSGEQSLQDWAEGVEQDARHICESASINSADVGVDVTPRRAPSSSNGTPRLHSSARKTVRRRISTASAAADHGDRPAPGYTRSTPERLSGSGQYIPSYYPSGPPQYSLASTGWPMHAVAGPYCVQPVQQQLYQGSRYGHLGFQGATRPMVSRGYGLQDDSRRVSRGSLTRSHSM